MVTFHTELLAAGKTATGFVVPPEVVAALGAGKRPAVTVTINGYSYRSTVAVMGGEFMLGVSAVNRTGAGVAAGDEIDVTLELDTTPRTVDVPPAFAAALAAEPAVQAAYEALSYSHQRQHVEAILGAKTEATRQRRIEWSMTKLRGSAQ